MTIRVLACELVEAVDAFPVKARQFFYRVLLIGHRYPGCNGYPDMVSEGQCRCVSCGKGFDPTVVFQRCPACGGVPVVRVRRYQCRDCGTPCSMDHRTMALGSYQSQVPCLRICRTNSDHAGLQGQRARLCGDRSGFAIIRALTPGFCQAKSMPARNG
jgi:hypothetical protein